MKPARSLIVNADDYGLTAGVSRGILDSHRRGIVTSTTLLVNRPVDPALIEQLKASGMGVGLHMNLTLGPPVAPAKRVDGLYRDPQLRRRSRRVDPVGGRGV